MTSELLVHAYDIEVNDKATNEEGDDHTEIRLFAVPIICFAPLYTSM